MDYFSSEDRAALAAAPGSDQAVQTARDKFTELNTILYRRLRDRNLDLHTYWQKSAVIARQSAAAATNTASLALAYSRTKEKAQQVERLMGRDDPTKNVNPDIFRHPVIELRLTPEYFTIELVLSPSAWWDQQNLVGKLTLSTHRDALNRILRRMNADEYLFGFWEGVHLEEAHLTVRQLLRSKALNDWLGTFSEGQDWLRVGVWYPPGHAAVDSDAIVTEATDRVAALYTIYNFILWSSNNDFRSFYERRISEAGSRRNLNSPR